MITWSHTMNRLSLLWLLVDQDLHQHVSLGGPSLTQPFAVLVTVFVYDIFLLFLEPASSELTRWRQGSFMIRHVGIIDRLLVIHRHLIRDLYGMTWIFCISCTCECGFAFLVCVLCSPLHSEGQWCLHRCIAGPGRGGSGAGCQTERQVWTIVHLPHFQTPPGDKPERNR